MDTELMDKKPVKLPFKFTKRKILFVSLITFILIMLALTAQLSYMTLKYDKIYKGIYVNNLNVGGLSKDGLSTVLKNNYEKKLASTSLVIKTPKYSQRINFSDLNITYDIKNIVDKAYKIGRTGNIFDKFYDIFVSAQRKIYLEQAFSYDPNKLKINLDSLNKNTFINVKDVSLYIQDKDNKVTLKSGHHGENIDLEKVHSQIDEKIKLCEGGTLDVSIINTAPSKINVDEIYNQIQRSVKDASIQILNKKLVFSPEFTGRNIDKNELTTIIEELDKNEDMAKVLPVIFTAPKVSIVDLESQLFKDDLYTKVTEFKTRNQNEINRSVNIRLDAAKINGTILAPGEIFSYNDIVGKKTPEQGYKDAFTYVAGKQVPGLGGGICQVSSTLYNAVLYSDLEVLQRRNHMFEVFYVPFGQDATVYYGSTDFQFKNSTNWPIKIVSSVTPNNQVIFSLKGTIENPGKTVKIQSSQVGPVVPFTIRYIDDPTVKGDVIAQTGHNGGTYVTYKTVYQDGKIISTKKISTSTYKPLEQVIKRVPPLVTLPSTPTPAKDLTPINPDVVP